MRKKTGSATRNRGLRSAAFGVGGLPIKMTLVRSGAGPVEHWSGQASEEARW